MEGVHPPLLGSPGLLRGMLPAYEDIITVAGKELSDPSVAEAMDAADDLAPLRAHFHIPPRDKAASASAGAHGAAASSSSSPGDVAGGEARTECIYLCGNSLGLQPRGVARYIEEELAKWRDVGASPLFPSPSPPPSSLSLSRPALTPISPSPQASRATSPGCGRGSPSTRSSATARPASWEPSATRCAADSSVGGVRCLSILHIPHRAAP
jgi:hypothetical protein